MDVREAATPLAKDEVHVWVARPARLTDAALAVCAGVLSEEERERVPRFRFERNRREATVSRALVRTTLARYVSRPPSAFAYRLGPHGRPDVDPPCGVAFNSTNHPDLVACAVCATSRGEEIGIDTEPLSRGDEILEVARTVFSDPELAALGALDLDGRRDRAVSLWTCKEAYIKARGLGFSASLKEIVVDFAANERPRLRFLAGYDEPDGWWLDTRDVMGFRVAVALRATGVNDGNVKLVVREAEWGDSERTGALVRA